MPVRLEGKWLLFSYTEGAASKVGRFVCSLLTLVAMMGSEATTRGPASFGCPGAQQVDEGENGLIFNQLHGLTVLTPIALNILMEVLLGIVNLRNGRWCHDAVTVLALRRYRVKFLALNRHLCAWFDGSLVCRNIAFCVDLARQRLS